MLKEQLSILSFPEVSLQSIFEQNLPVDKVFDELCGRVTLSIRRKNVDYLENQLQTMQRLHIDMARVDIFSDPVSSGHIEHDEKKFVVGFQ